MLLYQLMPMVHIAFDLPIYARLDIAYACRTQDNIAHFPQGMSIS